MFASRYCRTLVPLLSSRSLLSCRPSANIRTSLSTSPHIRFSSPRFNATLTTRPCPSCLHPLRSSLPACTNCWSISALPHDTKYHDIFDLPYDPNPFIVNLTVLKQKFREAQAICHPDSWASKGSQEIAQALSAQINEAYQGLLNPLPRAEYILRRHHVAISETDQVQDMELMLEVMQAREAIEDAEQRSEVVALIDENQTKIQNTVKELENLIGRREWEGARLAIIRLRYWESIARAAGLWLDNN